MSYDILKFYGLNFIIKIVKVFLSSPLVVFYFSTYCSSYHLFTHSSFYFSYHFLFHIFFHVDFFLPVTIFVYLLYFFVESVVVIFFSCSFIILLTFFSSLLFLCYDTTSMLHILFSVLQAILNILFKYSLYLLHFFLFYASPCFYIIY